MKKLKHIKEDAVMKRFLLIFSLGSNAIPINIIVFKIFKLRRVEVPYDIKEVFRRYSENGTMSIANLHRFLVGYQGEANATEEDAQSIFDSLKHLNLFQRKGIHLEGFLRYLFGDRNHTLVLDRQVKHDMNAPLAHYFIYTGHNSYLTGNQLNSNSSIEPIINALKNGVKVIELDLWPNSNKDDIDVFHGGTLTSTVKLIKCLEAINLHAFDASDYPVILTFEDHLTQDLQAKVAQMVTEIFGNTLFCPETEFAELPSPEYLKNKIMISTKPPKEYLEVEAVKKGGIDDDHHQVQDEDIQNAVAEYRKLISIHAVKLKGGIGNWLSYDGIDNVKRLSLSEEVLIDAAATHGPDIVRFTQRNLLRVYPKGTRVGSSNYNPLVGWMHGAQMVAFNMQGHGKHLWRMQGLFRANGGCGYFKKPDILLNSENVFDPREILPIRKYLKVKVYMGEGWHLDFHHTHFDRFSPPDFYARVGIAGVREDSVMQSTNSMEDDWEPVWNMEFVFPLTVPELALLRIEVMEYDTTKAHDFAGQNCLPVSELRTGIRMVPLYDRKGLKYKNARLLVRIQLI